MRRGPRPTPFTTFLKPERRCGEEIRWFPCRRLTSCSRSRAADGRLAGACQATLTNARPSAVAMIETDSAQPDDCNPAAIPLEFAERRAKALQICDMPAAVLRLQALGVWADRWLCPDVLGQLRACGRQPVDTVICSLLDVDPTLRVNRACAGAFPVEIVAAVALLGEPTCASACGLSSTLPNPLGLGH